MAAKGDVKHVRSRGSYGGGGTWNPDPEYRAASKRWYDGAKGDAYGYLSGLDDGNLVNAFQAMTRIDRYGDYDWYRLERKMSDSQRKELRDRINESVQKQNKEREARNKEWRERFDKERAEREAARLKKLEEETAEYRSSADLVAGMLQSDFSETFALKEVYGRDEGDWLDDPVAAYISGRGFGEEIREPAGIKLQVTLSLDVSNSMWNNRIAGSAVKAFIELGLALESLSIDNAGSLFTESFMFAASEDGKNSFRIRQATTERLGKYESVLDLANRQPYYAGEDTWITPLFNTIEDWENAESDPGCVRLDLIITDGVLEHPTDIRAASEIQERRDGALQTVLLNLLPEEEWRDSRLPRRCVQYPIDTDNIAGMLRTLLAQFVSVYV
jgi:hypothetical protein